MTQQVTDRFWQASVVTVSPVERGKSVARIGVVGSIKTAKAGANIIVRQLLINPIAMIVFDRVTPCNACKLT